MGSTSSTGHLQRAIGTRALACATVNAVVGSGIFVLPALVAADLGTAALLAYLACGVLVLLVGLCFAELGSSTTVSGGMYAFIGRAFGPYAGFLAGNLYLLGGGVTGDAAISNALADILAGFFPAMGQPWLRALFLVCLFGGLAALNISGVKRGVRLVELAMLGKFIPLVLLVLCAAPSVEAVNLHWPEASALHGFGPATLLLFFAFLGLETALANGGEMRQPHRTVPRGLLLGIGLVLALYVAIQAVAQGVLGSALAGAPAPLGALAAAVFGTAGAAAMLVVSAVSMGGTVGGNVLCAPRILYATASDGLLPRALARVHPRFSTPHVAIATYAAMGCILAIAGGFRQLAVVSTASVLLIYLGVVLAVIKGRLRPAALAAAGFRMRGGQLVPVLAACGIVWLLSNLALREFLWMAALAVLLSAWYAAVVLRRVAMANRQQIRTVQ
ncbi:MAG: APC family permease [Bacteroidetes bacterium]|nr:APC family permease [Bacteroidota bacterium]